MMVLTMPLWELSTLGTSIQTYIESNLIESYGGVKVDDFSEVLKMIRDQFQPHAIAKRCSRLIHCDGFFYIKES